MKSRKAIVVMLLIAVVSGFLLWIIAVRPLPYERQVLKDGTVLTLVGLTTGSNHEAPVASFKERLASRLPVKWANRLKLSPPPTTYSEHSSSNYLSVWFMAETARKPPNYRLLIGDGQGSLTSNNQDYGRGVSTRMSSNAWLIGLPVAAWPRRSETLEIEVYDPVDIHPLATFSVDNPSRDTATPAWTAGPWPVTVDDGELSFHVTRLWLGVGVNQKDWTHWEQQHPISRYTSVAFRVSQGETALTNWLAMHVREIRDATGNWSEGDGYFSVIRDGETINAFHRPPLPAGEAWRMTVEFSRVSGHASEEVYKVESEPVPQMGRSSLVTTHQFENVGLEFRWDQRSNVSGPVGVWIAGNPSRPDHRVTLVKVVDDRGRAVPFKNAGGGQSVTYELLDLARDAKWVTLDVAFHRSRLVTFLVEPEFFRAGSKE
jgi:hypothetical protein